MSLKLLLIKGKRTYDINDMLIDVKWQGRKGASARTLTVNVINDSVKSGIDVCEGHQCIFYENDDELFRGIIVTQTASDKRTLQFTAYDNGIYLANNKDTFAYENKTADQIFIDCCKRFGIPTAKVAKCKHRIPDLTKSAMSAFDTICDALSQDYNATGIRHYVTSNKGKLSLLVRRENILQYVLDTDANILSYSYSTSIKDIKTRLKYVSSEGKVVASRKNSKLEGKIGIFQDVSTPDENYTKAQVESLIEAMLKNESTPQRTLDITAMGASDVVSGMAIFVLIPEIGLKRAFYIDEDVHTYQGNKHTMKLKLNTASELDVPRIPIATTGGSGSGNGNNLKFKLADDVYFKGGSFYPGGDSPKALSTKCHAGSAKVTAILPDGAHQYHVIHTNNESEVYGWVNESSLRKR